MFFRLADNKDVQLAKMLKCHCRKLLHGYAKGLDHGRGEYEGIEVQE